MKIDNNFAKKWPELYNRKSRIDRANKIIKTLEDHFGKSLKKLTVLDIGSSTGIIDSVLAKKFKKVLGIDKDKAAVDFAKKSFKSKNLYFKVADALNIPSKDNSFDIIVCTHVYEHVENPKKLFKEIYRVLKRGGICYFAAINWLWPIEPHYFLPFLHWLPANLANYYLKSVKKSAHYEESLLSYIGLRRITGQFKLYDYTTKIYRSPEKYGYFFNKSQKKAGQVFSPVLKFLSPTFIWILEK